MQKNAQLGPSKQHTWPFNSALCANNMTTAKPEEVLAFIKKCHEDFQHYSLEITFDKKDSVDRNIIALYGSIIELTGSCIILVDKKMISAVPILLRSILEAYVDLINLINDPKYAHNLEVSYLKEWLRLLQQAKKGKNQYLKQISEADTLDDSIKDWTEQKEKLNKDGYKALTKENKFKLAGLEDEYYSIYNSLCSDSHNNLRSLMGRHIEFDDEEFSLVFYKDYSLEDSETYVGTNVGILIRATFAAHEFFKSPALEKLGEYNNEYNELQITST